MSQTQTAIRVALIEDQDEDRLRIVRLLESSPGFSCTAACRSANEALETLPQCQPGIVLADIRMPGMSGIDCVRLLKPRLPQAQFMMLTALEDHDLIFQSLQAGATGYVLKKTSPPKLLEAIAELHAGGAPMSGQIARKVVAFFHKAAPQRPDEKLSAMENVVLTKLGRGLLYKEVAEELEISVSTVRTHVYHIYQKLHVNNRTEAILKGLHPRQQPPAA